MGYICNRKRKLNVQRKLRRKVLHPITLLLLYNSHYTLPLKGFITILNQHTFIITNLRNWFQSIIQHLYILYFFLLAMLLSAVFVYITWSCIHLNTLLTNQIKGYNQWPSCCQAQLLLIETPPHFSILYLDHMIRGVMVHC